MISIPLNVRHVGMPEVLDQLQNQSKFPVEVGSNNWSLIVPCINLVMVHMYTRTLAALSFLMHS